MSVYMAFKNDGLLCMIFSGQLQKVFLFGKNRENGSKLYSESNSNDDECLHESMSIFYLHKSEIEKSPIFLA